MTDMTPSTEPKPQKIWNVPNILSLIRMVLVPVCIAAVLYAGKWFAGVAN